MMATHQLAKRVNGTTMRSYTISQPLFPPML